MYKESNNLYEILEVVLLKYSEDFSRKSRIESKLVGVVTFLSLLFAVSITVFLFFYNELLCLYDSKNIIILLSLSLFGQFYFMVSSITCAIIGYKTSYTNMIDIDELFKEWKTKKDLFLGSVSQTLHEASIRNNEVNAKLSFYFDLSRMFLIITFVFFIIFMCISFIIFFGGIYAK